VWLGQTCNLRCEFCYFLDRIEDKNHPEHPFITLDKAKEICRTLVDYYDNNSVDIQGGEATLWPHIFELVAYCNEIGLSPTIITNAQALASRQVVRRYREVGIRDFLVSIQGLGAVYDELVRRPGAHDRQMRALRNLQAEGIPFRFNTVVSKPVIDQLADIAQLAVHTGAEVVNFLGMNPFEDQATGKRTAHNVPRYDEAGPALDRALDILVAAGVEGNVRYLPFCVVAERHRCCVYNFPQIPYDLHENDYASWSWTELPAQRVRHAALSPPLDLGPRLRLGRLRYPVRRVAARWPALARGLHRCKQRLELARARRATSADLEARYQEEARIRAQEYTGYRHVPACASCDLRPVCDGFYGDYSDLFGTDEALSIRLGGQVTDPQHFSRLQVKKIHPADLAWLRE
jgi:MoaA/NifB/PqqE/SkfB family radical SAM enzyme